MAIVGIDPLLLVGLVLLGLLAILSQLTRRLRGGGAGQGRQTRVALTGQHTLHVVEIAGRRLLVGTGPSGAPRVLAELGEAESTVAAEQPALARPWAELLERFGWAQVTDERQSQGREEQASSHQNHCGEVPGGR